MRGYYINLEDRTDRNTSIQLLIQYQPFFKEVRRWNATAHENGSIGCALSHLAVLKQLDLELESPDDYAMVLEDDFFLLNADHFQQFLDHWETVRSNLVWDAIVLTPRGDPAPYSVPSMTAHHYARIHHHQTITGIIVRKRILPALIQSHQIALERMSRGEPLDDCAIDQQWKPLQDVYSFYYFQKIYAGQLPGYSSIERKVVDYNERFILQK